MKKALITGIRGQDGAYLAQFLLEKGYEVHGADRRSGDAIGWRLRELGVEKHIKMVYMDLLEYMNIIDVIRTLQPDEIYNLAAQSFVKTSFDQPMLTADINAIGTLRLLETIRMFSPQTRFYQASTSEIYGNARQSPQNETTPFYPRSPYGVAKLYAHGITVNYREAYGLFACSGIAFNHESPLRGYEFISRKVTHGIAQIQKGLLDTIVVGNLDAQRDWGYAREYVEAMWLMLQQAAPDDYVIATGEHHSIRELIEVAFDHVGIALKWQGSGVDEQGIDAKSGKVRVAVSPEFYRPAEVDVLVGDSSKARQKLGWKPRTTFRDLIALMVDADIKKTVAQGC